MNSLSDSPIDKAKQILISWVELEAKRHQLTPEGLVDVDAGRLIDHASIDAWTKSLEKSLKAMILR
ncbi:hypothetical protein [Nitrosomonas sp.]|uniref:hypothetical protein n=1 Tax=Nitrosomonas sp. TaxID=42353 RepID=UPI0032EB6A4F